MDHQTPSNEMSFALSKPAEAHLRDLLPGIVERMSAQELVPILSFCGGGKCEKDGKTVWEYHGPTFLLAGQRREALGAGRFYHVLGYRLWIGELETNMLQGRILTHIKVGGPEPMANLVIENAPDNYFEMAMDQCAESRHGRNGEVS